jgi:hypothetical protein
MGFVFALRLAHLLLAAQDAEVMFAAIQSTVANVKKCHGTPEATGAGRPGHCLGFKPAIDPNLSARDVVGVIAPRMVEF